MPTETNDKFKTLNTFFSNLSPVVNEEKQKQYIDLLERGIADQDVYNIALSGPYGSGKSSILKGFLAAHKKDKKKYLEISLANFQSGTNEETTSEDTPSTEQLIEKSILQQIFYTVGRTTVPYSRFSRIINRSFWNILGTTFLFATWGLSAYLTFHPKVFNTLSSYSWVNNVLGDAPNFLLLHGVFAVSSILILFLLIRASSMIKLSKLSFQGANIELGKDKGSLLNNNLDEILYFFETTSYEVLIIEDLDRHEVANIFKKLREINTLINNYENIDKKITFIYAVKDSLFTGEERTKFFEWIVPVIPIINTSNAKDKLIDKVEKAALSDDISITYLKDIAYYITDHRQLTNIFNEYLVYKQEINTLQEQEKLFSLIIYKNLFPKDFADLHNREGNVHFILTSQKEQLLEHIGKNISKQIEDVDRLIKDADEEHLKNYIELKEIYLMRIIKQNSDIAGFDVDDEKIGVYEAIENENIFKNLVNGKINEYYAINGYPQDFENVFDDEFEKRKKTIKQRNSTTRDKLSREKARLISEKSGIRYLSFKKLLSLSKDESILHPKGFDDDELWSEKDRNNWVLIEHLISNGYIDDSYPSFISYFYDSEMSYNDHALIQKIKKGTLSEPLAPIDNVKLVVEELSIHDFDQKAILNMNILDAFSLREDIFEELKRNQFFSTMFYPSPESIGFIGDALNNPSNENMVSFIFKKFVSHNNGLWLYLKDNKDSLFEENFLELFRELLISISNDDILALDGIDSLKGYIASMSDFLEFSSKIKDKNKLNDLLVLLEIKFNDFDVVSTSNRIVFNTILSNSLYQVNSTMLLSMIRIYLDNDEIEDLSYGAVSGYGITSISSYVEENIEQFVKIVLIREEHILTEKNSGFVALLKHDRVTLESKQNLISLRQEKIDKIRDVPSYCWESLLINERVVPSWTNVYYAYLNDDVDNATLLSYLSQSSVHEVLSEFNFLDSLPSNADRDVSRQLSLLLRTSSVITVEGLVSYRNSFTNCLSEINFSSISKERLVEMLVLEYFCTTPDNFDSLREILPPDDVLILLENNFDLVIDNYEEYSLDKDYITLLLSSEKIILTDKVEIINNLREEEVLELDAFELLHSILMSAPDVNILTNKNIFKSLVANLSSVEKSIRLLTKYMTLLDYQILEDLINLIDDPDYWVLNQKRKHAKLKKNEYNLDFLRIIKRSGYITSFKEEGNIYRAVVRST